MNSASATNRIVIGADASGTADNTLTVGGFSNNKITHWLPGSNNYTDLGSSDRMFKDIYFNGKLKGPASVSDIVEFSYDSKYTRRSKYLNYSKKVAISDADIVVTVDSERKYDTVVSIKPKSNGRFVATIGAQAGGKLFYSDDGVNWVGPISVSTARPRSGQK